jgi:hypothetical protein
MCRTPGRSCIIKTRAKADVAPRAALSAGACSAIARMMASSSQGSSYMRAGPTGPPNRSMANIVPEVPSTASARTWLKSHDEPNSEMTAQTQSHHVAGVVSSPKAVIATAAEPTVAPSPASAAARTPDVPTSIPITRAPIALSSNRLTIGFRFPVHELLLLGAGQHAYWRLFGNAGRNIRKTARHCVCILRC